MGKKIKDNLYITGDLNVSKTLNALNLEVTNDALLNTLNVKQKIHSKKVKTHNLHTNKIHVKGSCRFGNERIQYDGLVSPYETTHPIIELNTSSGVISLIAQNGENDDDPPSIVALLGGIITIKNKYVKPDSVIICSTSRDSSTEFYTLNIIDGYFDVNFMSTNIKSIDIHFLIC